MSTPGMAQKDSGSSELSASATSGASLLPPQEDKSYSFFGYRAHCCEVAMKADNAAMLSECVDRDFIDSDSTMLDNTSILGQCDRKGYTECAAMLRARGWQS